MKLTEAAELLGTQIEVNWSEFRRDFYCSLRGVEEKDGNILRSITGRGSTREAALNSLTSGLSGKPVVVNSMTKDRLELRLPNTIENDYE